MPEARASRAYINPAKRVRGAAIEDDANEGGNFQAADLDFADFMLSAVWLQISEDGREAIAQAAFGE